MRGIFFPNPLWAFALWYCFDDTIARLTQNPSVGQFPHGIAALICLIYLLWAWANPDLVR